MKIAPEETGGPVISGNSEILEDTRRERARTLILLNRAAGRDRTSDESDAFERMITERMGFDLCRMEKGADVGELTRDAVKEGYDMVVAAGGDGTIAKVAAALAGTGTRLGVLPLGTFNFFARSLGIPEEPEAALQVLSDGRPLALSLGRINHQIFINNASLGAYAAVLDARESIYARWGRSRLAAYWSVCVALLTLYRPLSMKITVDGEQHMVRSPMAFVAIRPYQLDEYGLAGGEDIESGRLALYLAPEGSRLSLFWRAIKVLLRSVEHGSDYRLLTGERIVIETHRRYRLVAHDGERMKMKGPYQIELLRDAITVMVPGGSDASP